MNCICALQFFVIYLLTFLPKSLVLSVKFITSGGEYKPFPYGPLRFDQENAPKDVSDVLAIFTNKFTAAREVSQIVRIEVRSEGNETQSFALSTVGIHTINATVQRLNQYNQVEDHLYSATFIITDVNECEVPRSHPMHHGCHYSTQCINTNGSYECACHSGTQAASGIAMGQCEGALNTSCCLQEHLGKKESINCKTAFQCEKVQCPGECIPDATCTLWEKDGRSLYKCLCPCDPQGNAQVGTGKQCKGPQPTAYKTKEGKLLGEVEDYCGCQTPKIDYCYQVDCGHNADCINDCNGSKYECRCKRGFKWFADLGCVDEKLPTLKLKGPNPLILGQCKAYEEFGVDIINDHEIPLSKSVEISYSQPLGSCLSKNGSFDVIYLLDTSWASSGSLFVKETRQVQVVPTNLCTLSMEMIESCPACQPKCSPEAKCQTIGGSYSCTCPRCLQGDGFVHDSYAQEPFPPPGYAGGTGCRNDVCPPTLTLSGKNPIYFEIPKCVDLSGEKLSDSCRPAFVRHLQQQIVATKGQVLCAERGVCAYASDDNGLEVVDRTAYITIALSESSSGTMNSDTSCQFQVSYDVKDAAGNRAETKYLKIIIQELTLEEVRKDCQQNRTGDIYTQHQCPQVDVSAKDLDQNLKEEISRHRVTQRKAEDYLQEITELKRQLQVQQPQTQNLKDEISRHRVTQRKAEDYLQEITELKRQLQVQQPQTQDNSNMFLDSFVHVSVFLLAPIAIVLSLKMLFWT